MPSIKISVLALATAVAAIPNYGGAHGGHAKYHKKVAANDKPYPTGGWGGAFNGTQVAPQPTGTGAGVDTTVDVTSTSTETLVKTVVVKPSPEPVKASVQDVGGDNAGNNAGADAANDAGNGDSCGPATVTVTASQQVTVTVTPGAGVPMPSSAAPVADEEAGEPTPEVKEVKPQPTPVAAAVSSKAEQGYPANSPAAPAPEAPEAPSPAPEAPSSKAPEAPAPSSKVEQPAASSAAPSATPSKAPSSGGSYNGAKRGLAYNDASLCKELGSSFGFGYNWGQVENNDIGTQFIPMMHRPSESSASDWLKNVDKAASKGTKAVMGFNEPDHAAQANLSPAAACAAWKEYMNPIASSHPDLTIIGPSVTNGPPPMGIDWLSRFHDSCPDAVVHATNIHFYDIYEDATIDRFQEQIEKAAQLYGKPVWVTEFGLNPGSASQEQAVSFLEKAMAYMDASDKVQGYSWFMVGDGENQITPGSVVAKVYGS